MLISDEALQFCARKTREIVEHYERDCILPSEVADGGFPRSVDDLHHMVSGHSDKRIYHRNLTTISKSHALFRSFCIPYEDRCEIYYVSGLSKAELRYYKAKELFQLHLMQEVWATTDIVDLVKNMILRAMPESLDLNLGHAATSDTLGDIAAMEFLFPVQLRLEFLGGSPQHNGIVELGKRYGIPPFIVQRALGTVEVWADVYLKG